MSPEASTKDKLGHRELALGYTIGYYEQPLLSGLWNRLHDQTISTGQKRGWLVCLPATVALSRVINWVTGIPISKDADPRTQEHLRLSRVYLYKPPNASLQDLEDHEFLSYYNGKGYVTHIDVTYDLTWGKKKHLTGEDDLRGTIHMRKFLVEDYEEALQKIYHLYPYDASGELAKQLSEYNHLTPVTENFLDEMYSARYTDQITSAIPLNPSITPERWKNSDRIGLPLAQFIRTLIPEWTGIK